MRLQQIEPHRDLYRMHQVGRVLGLHGWKAAWRHALDDDWIISSVYADDKKDAFRLARECVDYRERESLLALRLGRCLTIADLIEHKALLTVKGN